MLSCFSVDFSIDYVIFLLQQQLNPVWHNFCKISVIKPVKTRPIRMQISYAHKQHRAHKGPTVFSVHFPVFNFFAFYFFIVGF